MTDIDWSDIRPRLAALAAHPRSGEVFGSGGHEWVLEPALTGPELADLEAQFGVELPADYRAFLRQAGRGGAGPAYGLFPVLRKGDSWRWSGDGADLTETARLAEPFPHTEAFNPAEGFPEPPDEEEGEDAEDAYWEEHTRMLAEVSTPGLLYLCHLGCAYREALVVSGPHRGVMWADDMADDGGYRPVPDTDGQPQTFTRWYRTWLDQAEATVSKP
ncbi:SMI1/KNR4 family protein [Actinoplanes couchii]|uniref:SMI1/KNR4 family protein n=1 Tax=Actinoplanes couchii TaxID=403638 RepID=UPI001941B2B8|nr:SMI1/KNR4 family protein [Actinoplanes couchii]MDR6323474.1 hypothetical protein [Actinoplanes couchii]